MRNVSFWCRRVSMLVLEFCRRCVIVASSACDCRKTGSSVRVASNSMLFSESIHVECLYQRTQEGLSSL